LVATIFLVRIFRPQAHKLRQFEENMANLDITFVIPLKNKFAGLLMHQRFIKICANSKNILSYSLH
jgi:hypothetical protein